MMNIQYHGTSLQGKGKENQSSHFAWGLPLRVGALTVEETIQERLHDSGFSNRTDELQREVIVVPVRTIHIGEHCLPQMVDVAINCMTAPMGTSFQRPQAIEIDFAGNPVVDCWQQETMVEIGSQGLPVIKST
jgi:hypothetical protein